MHIYRICVGYAAICVNFVSAGMVMNWGSWLKRDRFIFINWFALCLEVFMVTITRSLLKTFIVGQARFAQKLDAQHTIAVTNYHCDARISRSSEPSLVYRLAMPWDCIPECNTRYCLGCLPQANPSWPRIGSRQFNSCQCIQSSWIGSGVAFFNSVRFSSLEYRFRSHIRFRLGRAYTHFIYQRTYF